jgi:hypothetical protein
VKLGIKVDGCTFTIDPNNVLLSALTTSLLPSLRPSIAESQSIDEQS